MHAISRGHSVSTEAFLHTSLRIPSLILILKKKDPETYKNTRHCLQYYSPSSVIKKKKSFKESAMT